MTWLVGIVGAALVAVALWDVFHTLWHPSGQGRICKTVMRLLWWLSNHTGAAGQKLSGPAAMLLVIATWAGLIIVGSALVYWPHIPEAFSFSPGLAPDERNNLLDALYLSFVTLTTLGFGDIVPTAPWLRLVIPLQALLGFALLTAAVSWVLQVYPALTRRRALALKLDALRRAGTTDVLPAMHPQTAAGVLADITDGIGHVYVDLLQYSETYYFRDAVPRTTLAMTVSQAAELAHVAHQSTSPEVRHAGAALAAVLDDLAEVLDDQYLHTGADTNGVLSAYRDNQSLSSSS